MTSLITYTAAVIRTGRVKAVSTRPQAQPHNRVPLMHVIVSASHSSLIYKLLPKMP